LELKLFTELLIELAKVSPTLLFVAIMFFAFYKLSLKYIKAINSLAENKSKSLDCLKNKVEEIDIKIDKMKENAEVFENRINNDLIRIYSKLEDLSEIYSSEEGKGG
jgi:hypothetical protein